jgi:hypothetical protein
MALIFLLFGLLFVGYGLVGLIGAWRAPQLFSIRLYSPPLLSAKNRTPRLWFLMLMGAYLTLSAAGASYWSYIPLVASFVPAANLLRRPPQSAR